MPAEEALAVGLVSQVVSQEELLNTAAILAEKIMNNSSNAMGHALKAIAAAYQEGVAGFEEEINAFGECFAHPEFKEGTQAFLEKRKANF